MENKITESERNTIKAHLLVRHNYAAEDFEVLLVDEIQTNNKDLIEQIKALIETTKKVGELVKSQTQPVQLTTKSQALLLYFFPSLVFLIFSTAIFYVSVSIGKFNRKNLFIKHATEIELLLDKATVSEKGNMKYLILKPAPKKGKAKAGEYYIVNGNSIKIPLTNP